MTEAGTKTPKKKPGRPNKYKSPRDRHIAYNLKYPQITFRVSSKLEQEFPSFMEYFVALQEELGLKPSETAAYCVLQVIRQQKRKLQKRIKGNRKEK